ncbi:folylpolyglutamate synthase [Aspergillus crustosus]
MKRRTYENALSLLETRRRPARPTNLSISASATTATKNPTSLRGVPSLVGMKEWLQALGHSETQLDDLNIIHVSGTKGKGSTCAFARGFLHAHGKRTGFPRRLGLYTGPHLQTICERIQIDDHPISEDMFTRYFFEVWDCFMSDKIPQASGFSTNPRYLQFMALLAIHTFIGKGVDAAIFEVHHGGEYDATNVIQRPVVTGITSLGLDHVAQLGPTLESIAWHKAGIFKSGAPAFSVSQEPGCSEAMRNRALDRSTSLSFVSVNDSLPPVGILGVYVQRLNCSLALELARAFLTAKAPSHALTKEDIAHGVDNYSLAGRFEVISKNNVQWFVDGAHNPLSLEQSAHWFGMHTSAEYKHRILIFSHISQQRDGVILVDALAHALLNNNARPDHVIFTSYQDRDDDSSNRGIDVPDISFHDLCASYSIAWKNIDPGAKITVTSTIERAVKLARGFGDQDELVQVLVTGSLSMVGGALGFL